MIMLLFFVFQAEDGIRDHCVTGVQTCALPICASRPHSHPRRAFRARRPGSSPSWWRRSEERRVGKECRSRWLPYHLKKKIAMLYSLLHIDYDALAMRLDRGLGITAETGHSWIISAGTLGIYATSIAAILLAFFAVPRGRFGVSALSWVFLLMGISLLTRLVQCWWLRYLGWYIQIPSCISTICFALPALIM